MSTTKKPMTLAEALRQWDSKDEAIREEARATMRDKIGHRAVIERGPDGKIVVEETMDRLDVAKSHPGNDEQAGCVTPAALFAENKPQREADPIDGRLLRNGKTLTRPVVDWSGLPIGKDPATCPRRIAAYAAERGEAEESRYAVFHLPQAPLPPPWDTLAPEWAALLAKPRKTPADQALIARVEARLYVQETPPFAEAPPVPVQASGVHIGGSVTGSNTFREPCEADRPGKGCPGIRGACGRPGQMGQCGRVILGAPKGKRLFVIASHSEADFLAGIDKQFHFAKKEGLRISSTLASPSGAVVANWIAEEMQQAHVIAVLVSAECAAQYHDVIAAATMLWRQGSARVIPILARPFDDVALREFVALPRGGKPISTYQDKDAVYCEIAKEMRIYLQ